MVLSRRLIGTVITSAVLMMLSGCGKDKVYKEDDLYKKEGKYFEKDGDSEANGILRDFDGDSLEKETPLNDGVIDGVVKGYHNGGKLSYETPYSDGKSNGIEKVYNDDGKVIRETPIKDGKEEGVATTYYDSGEKKAEVPFKDGKKEGKASFYKKDGSLFIEINFSNGQPQNGVEHLEDGTTTPLTTRRYIQLF